MLDTKHFAGLILNDQLGLSLSSLKSQDVTLPKIIQVWLWQGPGVGAGLLRCNLHTVKSPFVVHNSEFLKHTHTDV